MSTYRHRVVSPEEYRGVCLQPIYTGRWMVNRRGAMEPVIRPIVYVAYADCGACGGKGYVREAIVYGGGSFQELDAQCGICARRKENEQC